MGYLYMTHRDADTKQWHRLRNQKVFNSQQSSYKDLNGPPGR